MLGPDQVSQRWACRALGQCRSTQRRKPAVPDDEPRLVARVVGLATEYGRYGYRRRVAALLRSEGFSVNHKRVERLWRREGLKVQRRQPKRGRLWLRDGSCVRLRPERKDHVWSYDIVHTRTRDGRAFRMLNVIDAYTRECLAIDVARRLTSDDALERLSDLFARRGVPGHIRSDYGPEFTAKAVRDWLGRVGSKALFIEPGSPWENGYVESFNGKLSDELLEGEVFDTQLEAKVLIERWRVCYNTVRPHSRLGYRPPAPGAFRPGTPGLGATLLPPASMAGAAGTLTWRVASAMEAGQLHLPAGGPPAILESPGFPIGLAEETYVERSVRPRTSEQRPRADRLPTCREFVRSHAGPEAMIPNSPAPAHDDAGAERPRFDRSPPGVAGGHRSEGTQEGRRRRRGSSRDRRRLWVRSSIQRPDFGPRIVEVELALKVAFPRYDAVIVGCRFRPRGERPSLATP